MKRDYFDEGYTAFEEGVDKQKYINDRIRSTGFTSYGSLYFAAAS